MKKVLITGAAGFLGSHLVQSFLNDNCYVIGLDNLQTGSLRNIKNIDSNRFEFIEHDVRDSYNELGKFDIIANLACPASPPKYQIDPIGTMMTSIIGIQNALKCADNNPGCIVFQASTSEIYGNPLVHPQPETYTGNVETTSIRSCYDEGKRAAETIMTDWHRTKNTQIRIARIFNTYGPNMDMEPSAGDGRVVSNFIAQALNNEPVTVYGDGTQTRSFCYVSDLISGFRKLINSDIQTPVNLGNPVEYSVLELAKIIITKTNSNSSIVYKDLPAHDPMIRKPDITKAKQYLQWEPTVLLDQGLEKMIEYFKETYL